MSVRTTPWPTGAPAWIGLTVAGLGAATGFYGDLLGWDFLEGTGPDGRTYLTALRDRRPVAGLGQPADPATPAQWTVFLATDDAARDARAAADAGGAVVVAPTPAGTSGTAALLTDPTGAVVGLWQAGDHLGVTLTDVPGAPAWCELVTPDLAAAQAFYAGVLRVRLEPVPGPATYLSVVTDEGPVAGLREPRPDDDAAPHWLAYLAVADVDAAVEVALGHGGVAEVPAADTPLGRVAVLRGPSRERFALLDATEED